MQHHRRSRLPPQPFGRGGGAGYSRGHRQMYAPPPPAPLPAPPPPPHRRYEVLMEAGRLAAEYLVSKGVLPPSSLQRGSGGGAWVAPPPPPQQQQQQEEEPPGFYGRRRYEDEYSNNPITRSRRNSSTTTTTSRDDYSSGGNYTGRGKRKYGEYRRGYSDGGRERGRSSSNGRRYEEDKDEDGAPGFRRERRGSGWNDEARSCVMEVVREATPLMVKAVGELEMEDTRSKALSSSRDVRKGVDGPPEVQSENEEGEMEDSKVSSSKSEVVELGIDPNGDGNNSSTGAVMEAEATLLLDGKVPEEKAEDAEKVLCGAALVRTALDDEMTNLENDLHDDRRNLLKYCDFAKTPTRPRSVRACRNAASIQRETVDLVSSGEASQMVVDEATNEGSLTNIQSDNREDPTYQENTRSSTVCNEIREPMLLQENKTSVVTENIREEKSNAQFHVVQECKEETDVSLLTASQKDRLMQETDLCPLRASLKDGLVQETNLSPLTDSHKDSLVEETNLSLLTDSHKDSLIEETDLSPLAASHKDNYSHKDSLIEEAVLSPSTASHKDSSMQETDLSRTISSCEDTLKLQFKEETQICDVDVLPQHVDLIELSDQRKIVGELFPNVGVEPIIKMEQEKLDQSSSFKICDLDFVGGTKVSTMHNNPGLAQCSVEGSSAEQQKQQQEGFGTSAGGNVSGADGLCQLPLDNKAVQVIDIEDDTPIEVGDFDSSKAKDEMICSSMDNAMNPGVHTDDLPGIRDGYNLAISDYLGADIPCYPSMQSDLQAGICANDSEGIPVMDDPIYGSLTDIDGLCFGGINWDS